MVIGGMYNWAYSFARTSTRDTLYSSPLLALYRAIRFGMYAMMSDKAKRDRGGKNNVPCVELYVQCCSIVLFLLYDLWYANLNNSGSVGRKLLLEGRAAPAIRVRPVTAEAASEPVLLRDLLLVNAGSSSSSSSAGESKQQLQQDKACCYTLVVFLRGVWCPLCDAQLSELVARAADFTQARCRVVIVSPQPRAKHEAWARRHAARAPAFVFATIDVAELVQLGLLHECGVPPGMTAGGTQHTVFPAELVLDNSHSSSKNGIILYSVISPDYRVRPDCAEFLDAIEQAKATNAKHGEQQLKQD
jgi:peroxiredoxin